MLWRDKESTLARGFKSNRSCVTTDGREILAEDDWAVRKLELWNRAKGRCENIIGTAGGRRACGQPGSDPHHVQARSKGRDDRLANLLLVCRACHRALDRRQPRWTKSRSVYQ
jgi:hypothetical protein